MCGVARPLVCLRGDVESSLVCEIGCLFIRRWYRIEALPKYDSWLKREVINTQSTV